MGEQSGFGDFYKSLGFNEYPFSLFTSEHEKEKSYKLFVNPEGYDPIVESFSAGNTLFVVGERGSGKTAAIFDMERKISKESSLWVYIDDFSSLDEEYSQDSFYEFLIANIANSLFPKILSEKKKIKTLSKADRHFLSFIQYNYLNASTVAHLREEVSEMQNGRGIYKAKTIYNNVAYAINYGLNSLKEIGKDGVSIFLGIPPFRESEFKNYFPELNADAATSFSGTPEGHYFLLLRKLAGVCKKAGYTNVIIAFDKIDEDQRFDNDAERVSRFIKPILQDSKLLLCDFLQIVFSIWTVPLNFIKDDIRTQKHNFANIGWNFKSLEKALDRRIQIFSGEDAKSYKSIFDANVSDDEMQGIFELSNTNPRDLWHLFDKILRGQYEIGPESFVSSAAIRKGKEDFVKTFDFFEYYPRKSNAKASSMDVYAYIRHLQKLDGIEFTKNKLNSMANTGSSTNGYVTNMEKMGLVEKVGQESGSAVYRIADPKVVYAMENGIEIQKG